MADINCTLQGSEEIYETCCSPCLEVGKTKEARTFCADCGSHLCEKCVRDHNKFVALRSHRLTDMCNQESKGECEGKRTAVTSVQIARCATHRGKLLDMYCEDHSQFCCPSCVTVKHRSCKNVDSLSNVAKRFKDSDQHKEIKEVIENIKIKAVAERKKRKEYLASLDSEKNKLLQDVEKYHDDIINKVKELTETTRRKILSRHKEYQKPVELDNIALETVISTMNSYSEKQMDPNVEQLFLDAQAGKVAAKEGGWLIDDLPTDWEKTIPFCFNLEVKQKLDSSEALGEMTDAVKEVCEFSKCTDVLHKVLEGCDKSSLLHAFLHLYLMPSPNTGLESDRHSTCELQGFLKRTYQCKECHHNSESTKPFYHLPIPVMQLHKLLKKQMRQLTLFWVPYSAREKPIQFKLLLAKNSVVADLCDELSGYVKVDKNHMVVTDVYNHEFHRVFAMSEAVSQIMDRDDIFIYEVPGKDNSDMIMLPVYMTEMRVFSFQLFGTPSFVTVQRSNCSYTDLYNIVLERISRFVYVPGDDESQDIPRKSQNGNIAGSESLQKIFEFSVVNSYGTTEMDHELNDDGNHLKLSSGMYISANWSVEDKKEFYNESEAESFEIHLTVTKETTNIEQLLEQFTATEDLDESSARYCEKCVKKLPVAKKFDLLSLPNTLVIHLDRNASEGGKEIWIDFPTRGLDLGKYVKNEPENNCLFDLIGVINYDDSKHTLYCKNDKDNTWYFIDSTGIAESTEEAVTSKGAYGLVYRSRQRK